MLFTQQNVDVFNESIVYHILLDYGPHGGYLKRLQSMVRGSMFCLMDCVTLPGANSIDRVVIVGVEGVDGVSGCHGYWCNNKGGRIRWWPPKASTNNVLSLFHNVPGGMTIGRSKPFEQLVILEVCLLGVVII